MKIIVVFAGKAENILFTERLDFRLPCAEMYLFSQLISRGVTSLNYIELQVAVQTFSYLCFETRKMFQRNLFQHQMCILHTILVRFCIILQERNAYKNQNCFSFYCVTSGECKETARSRGDEKPGTSGSNVANKLGATMKCTDHLRWMS